VLADVHTLAAANVKEVGESDILLFVGYGQVPGTNPSPALMQTHVRSAEGTRNTGPLFAALLRSCDAGAKPRSWRSSGYLALLDQVVRHKETFYIKCISDKYGDSDDYALFFTDLSTSGQTVRRSCAPFAQSQDANS
jgi:hypothetical protein